MTEAETRPEYIAFYARVREVRRAGERPMLAVLCPVCYHVAWSVDPENDGKQWQGTEVVLCTCDPKFRRLPNETRQAHGDVQTTHNIRRVVLKKGD